jgi:hypothetical protein
VDGVPPALGVRVGLDARDQLRRAPLRDRPALGVEPPRHPGGRRIGQEPVGHHPHARRQPVPTLSAGRSQNPSSSPPTAKNTPAATRYSGDGRLRARSSRPRCESGREGGGSGGERADTLARAMDRRGRGDGLRRR